MTYIILTLILITLIGIHYSHWITQKQIAWCQYKLILNRKYIDELRSELSEFQDQHNDFATDTQKTIELAKADLHGISKKLQDVKSDLFWTNERGDQNCEGLNYLKMEVEQAKETGKTRNEALTRRVSLLEGKPNFDKLKEQLQDF